MKDFHYENKEVKMHKGEKVVRRVKIMDGKGYKSVTKYKGGKKVGTAKKVICKEHVTMIKSGKFIPGLFSDCKCDEKNSTKKQCLKKSNTAKSKTLKKY